MPDEPAIHREHGACGRRISLCDRATVVGLTTSLMRRSDYYVFALAALQIFLFLHLSSLINAGAGVSMMTQGGLDAYVSIALFVAAYGIVFGNLARLAKAMMHTIDEASAMGEIFKTFRLSIVGFILLLAIQFIQAFLLLNVPAF